jgi:hypothetical protein
MKNNLNESASDEKTIQKKESELSLFSINLIIQSYKMLSRMMSKITIMIA